MLYDGDTSVSRVGLDEIDEVVEVNWMVVCEGIMWSARRKLLSAECAIDEVNSKNKEIMGK